MHGTDIAEIKFGLQMGRVNQTMMNIGTDSEAHDFSQIAKGGNKQKFVTCKFLNAETTYNFGQKDEDSDGDDLGDGMDEQQSYNKLEDIKE
jgi:hypothetical protein